MLCSDRFVMFITDHDSPRGSQRNYVRKRSASHNRTAAAGSASVLREASNSPAPSIQPERLPVRHIWRFLKEEEVVRSEITNP
jgi:hypothetical protein